MIVSSSCLLAALLYISFLVTESSKGVKVQQSAKPLSVRKLQRPISVESKDLPYCQSFSSDHLRYENPFAFLSAYGRKDSLDTKVLHRRSLTPLGAVQKSKAPDLSSTLLNERIVFIGLPIQNVVAHLVISQLLYLDNVSQKPIKIYINCADYPIQDDNKARAEVDALNIVDVMRYVKSDVITVNLGKAYGPAALILAAGTPGKRFVLPRSFTALRQLPTSLEMMQAEDLRIYSKDILKCRKDLVKELAKCCQKPESMLLEAIQRGSYLDSEETLAYGLADNILENGNVEFKGDN